MDSKKHPIQRFRVVTWPSKSEYLIAVSGELRYDLNRLLRPQMHRSDDAPLLLLHYGNGGISIVVLLGILMTFVNVLCRVVRASAGRG